MKIGVEGFKFDSAHYTEGITDKCKNIHGHTFTVDVEVEGEEIDEKTGMVIDFGIIKNNVRDVLEEWDHKFLIPEDRVEEVETEGPFDFEVKAVNGSSATTENIAKNISKEIYEKINLPVKVKVYEGENSFAISRWPK